MHFRPFAMLLMPRNSIKAKQMCRPERSEGSGPLRGSDGLLFEIIGLGLAPALFKSRIWAIGGGRERPCLSPDAEGASLGREPAGNESKFVGFEYSLDFFWLLFCVNAKK
jgi:hypothetical protein